ncbi:hypothetical protein [Bradyrhizobium sp. dw_78]|uniref:hypothetical protein n=1 Tax=Bradyrhizobium sp. dw_78 TaxID=2719793 RepID=UPI001BD3A1C0|nr:hypothetical protein [Bradyrhizobium sp. dw_78]
MPSVDLGNLPTWLAAYLRKIGIECRAGVSLGADIVALGNLVAATFETRFLGVGADRLRGRLRIDPLAVLLRNAEGRGRRLLHRYVTTAKRRLDRGLERRRRFVEQRVAVLGEERIQEYDGRYPIAQLIGHTADGETSIGMPDEYDVRKIFPFDDICDIGYMRGDVHVLRDEMGAFAQAGQRREEYLVAALLQQVRHPPPAPSTMPGTMNQHEGPGSALRMQGTR